MSAATIDKLSWLLIYGGIAAMSLGIFVRREDVHLGWVIIGAGAVATFFGALLIFVRSRHDETIKDPR
jgi:hypothetical protein